MRDFQRITFSAPGGEAWEVRLDLETLGAAEVVGVGSITTAPAAARRRRNWDVAVGGRLGAEGRATLRLEPTDSNRHPVVTMVVRVTSDPVTDDPLVGEVLEVVV